MQRILVVDDAELNRELLCDMLKDEYQVETAEDGREALNYLDKYPREMAAVLLDLHMPHMDGYAVMAEMSKKEWLKRIPVLIISSELAVEAESRCLELGASDFIHKPFERAIVKNRIKNAMRLYTRKNQLERKVEEQAVMLRKQDQIIRIQAEKLTAAEPFHRVMLEYQAAIMEIETRLKILNAEFSQEYKRNPFESIKSRLKSPESIYEKLERKGYPVTVESIQENLKDVAGIRVICSFPDDIYRLADLMIKQDDIILQRRKDYIQNPKSNGYRSLHLIIGVPVYLSREKKYMMAEVQFRTIAMDFWASLEHKLKYKKVVDNTEEIVRQLKVCADSIEELDYQMQKIRNRIDHSRE